METVVQYFGTFLEVFLPLGKTTCLTHRVLVSEQLLLMLSSSVCDHCVSGPQGQVVTKSSASAVVRATMYTSHKKLFSRDDFIPKHIQCPMLAWSLALGRFQCRNPESQVWATPRPMEFSLLPCAKRPYALGICRSLTVSEFTNDTSFIPTSRRYQSLKRCWSQSRKSEFFPK